MKEYVLTVSSLVFAFFLFAGCAAESSVKVEEYGALSDGTMTHKFTLSNSSGASVQVCDYGARLVAVNVPDRNGRIDDVIVGFDDIRSFEQGRKCYRFIGCVLGRYANRIAGPSVIIDGKEYEIECNENRGIPVQLHGGDKGFDRHVWTAVPVEESDRCGVRFSRLSPDGEAGLPGNVQCEVTYWLTEDNACIIEYKAQTDRPTFVNLSNHTYFNMKGARGGYVFDHILSVNADSCIYNSRQSIPDVIMPVEETPLDFRTPARFDYRMTEENIGRVRNGSWIIKGWDGSLQKIAEIYAPVCGRGVEVWSTEPNLVTEAGGGFDGTVAGKYGMIPKHGGMLLETLHMADSPNQPRFPGTLLRPGQTYYSQTQYRFYAR